MASEDLQDGQDLQGILRVNPFSHSPKEILDKTGSP